MILTGETDVMGEIPCHLATLFTTVLTGTGLAFNPIPQIICLCRGTADFEGKVGIHSPLHIKIHCLPLRKQAVKL